MKLTVEIYIIFTMKFFDRDFNSNITIEQIFFINKAGIQDRNKVENYIFWNCDTITIHGAP